MSHICELHHKLMEARGEDTSGRGVAGSVARHGLPGLRLPADRPGQ